MLEYISIFVAGVLMNLLGRIALFGGLEDVEPSRAALWAIATGALLLALTLFLGDAITYRPI